MGRPLEDLGKKFWAKVRKRSGCWEWKASKFKAGYGQISHAGKNLKAHRVSYFLHFGPIPEGMLVCHTCDNPSCANPKHLFLGTPRDNVRDQMAKGRRPKMLGERNGMAKLTSGTVKEIRKIYGKLDQYEIAREYGICQSHVSAILSGRRWASVK